MIYGFPDRLCFHPLQKNGSPRHIINGTRRGWNMGLEIEWNPRGECKRYVPSLFTRIVRRLRRS